MPLPLIILRDGRALDETSDMVDDVNILKPHVSALVAAAAAAHASPAHSSRSLGSEFTPDITPISSSSPSEVDPTEVRDSLTDTDAEDTGNAANAAEEDIANAANATEGATETEGDEKVFRDYANACDRVKNFYAEQHAKQTMEYNLKARNYFHEREKLRMGVWEAIERLNTLVDDSDPDTALSQIEHLLQTAESIRKDGKPDWMQLVGLIHDLGKLLFFLGAEGQWDVVGDTFVVGCQFSEKNIYPETFSVNPDSTHPVYSTPNGIYEPGCGMENVMISWGHDEYMYIIAKEQSTLPKEGLAMIRFHSFYPWHRENAYTQFMKAGDEALLAAVRDFNPYDLYSKADEPIEVESVKEYYQTLIAKYFPPVIEW